MSGVECRLAVFAANGDRLGLLPYPVDVQVSLPFCDVPSLKFDYSLDAAGAGLVDVPLSVGREVAVEVHVDGVWVEPSGGRFLVVERAQNSGQSGDVVSFQCVGWAFALSKAQVKDHTASFGVDRVLYLDATAGTILGEQFTNARQAGELAGMSWSFTGTRDSAGRAWTQRLESVAYDVGAGLDQVLAGLVNAGLVEWETVGRELRVYEAGTVLATDTTVTEFPVFIPDEDRLPNSPDTQTIRGLASSALVRGGGDVEFVANKQDAPTPWGKWSTYMKLNGVGIEATARMMADHALQKQGRVAREIVRELPPSSVLNPVKDLRLGSYVLVGGVSGWEKARVRQVSIVSKRDGGVLVWSVAVKLNDRFLESDIARQRVLDLLTGANTVGGSGTSSGIDPERDPGVPVSLTVQAAPYLDVNGLPANVVQLAWSLSVGTGGEGLYIVEGRPYSSPAWRSFGVYGAPDAQLTGLPCGETWQFRVANYYGVRTSDWCVSDPVPLPRYVAVVTKPAGVTMSSRLGNIVVAWDGTCQLPGAGTVPSGVWFNQVEVCVADVAVPSDTVAGRILSSPGSVALGSYPVGAVRWVWARLVDNAGNRSDWVPLPGSPVTVLGVSGPDITAGTVTANQLDVGSVTGGIATFLNANINQVSGVTSTFVNSIVDNIRGRTAVFQGLWATMATVGELSADNIKGGTITAAFVRADKIHADSYHGLDLGEGSVENNAFKIDRYGNLATIGRINVGAYTQAGSQIILNAGTRSIYFTYGTGDTAVGGNTGYITAQGNGLRMGWGVSFDSDVYVSGEVDSYSLRMRTSASAGSSRTPNMCIGEDDVIRRISSAAWTKEQVQDLGGVLVKARNMVDLVPVRQFYSKMEMDQWRGLGSNPGNHPTPIPGVIAEEVLAAGLDDFVVWEPDPGVLGPSVPWETGGKPGRRVQGVMYDRLTLLAFPLIKELYAKVGALEARVAVLENAGV